MVYNCPLDQAIRQGWVKNIEFREVFLEQARFYRDTPASEPSTPPTKKSQKQPYPDEYYMNTEQLDEHRNRRWLCSQSKVDKTIRDQVSVVSRDCSRRSSCVRKPIGALVVPRSQFVLKKSGLMNCKLSSLVSILISCVTLVNWFYIIYFSVLFSNIRI